MLRGSLLLRVHFRALARPLPLAARTSSCSFSLPRSVLHFSTNSSKRADGHLTSITVENGRTGDDFKARTSFVAADSRSFARSDSSKGDGLPGSRSAEPLPFASIRQAVSLSRLKQSMHGLSTFVRTMFAAPPPLSHMERMISLTERSPVVLRILARPLVFLLPYFMPQRMEQAVTPNYFHFTMWQTLAAIAGSAASVLSTQALLMAVGMSAPVAAPAAAGINWVMKDCLGQIGGAIWSSTISVRFDADPKRWRAIANITLILSALLEVVTPAVPGLFLPLAAIANMGKNVSWLATSATRACINLSFLKLDNIADITAKTTSQSIAAGVLGTSLGVALSWAVTASGPLHWTVLSYLLLAIIQHYCLHVSLLHVAVPSLNVQRATILTDEYIRCDAVVPPLFDPYRISSTTTATSPTFLPDHTPTVFPTFSNPLEPTYFDFSPAAVAQRETIHKTFVPSEAGLVALRFGTFATAEDFAARPDDLALSLQQASPDQKYIVHVTLSNGLLRNASSTSSSSSSSSSTTATATPSVAQLLAEHGLKNSSYRRRWMKLAEYVPGAPRRRLDALAPVQVKVAMLQGASDADEAVAFLHARALVKRIEADLQATLAGADATSSPTKPTTAALLADPGNGHDVFASYAEAVLRECDKWVRKHRDSWMTMLRVRGWNVTHLQLMPYPVRFTFNMK